MDELHSYKTNCLNCNKEMDLYQSSTIKGKLYYRKDRVNKFCSNKCNGEYKIRNIPKKCPTCSIEFFTKPHESKLFCSTKCSTTRKNFTKKCDSCQKDFVSSHIRSKFCSKQCHRNNRLSEVRTKNNTQIYTKKCQSCDNYFKGSCKQIFCCRECKRPKKHVYKERAINIKKELVQLKGGCCQICKTYFDELSKYCFHHIRDKKFTLDQSNLLKYSMNEILNELDKCVLLCHNCHVIEHQNAKNKRKIRKGQQIKEILIEQLGNVCSECGWNSKYTATLSFDHLYDKKFELNIKELSYRTIDEINEEVKKCQLLCINCHIGKNETKDR